MKYVRVEKMTTADLDAPPGQLWEAAIAQTNIVDSARSLFRSASRQLADVPELFALLFPWIYYLEGGPYFQEMKAWSRATAFPLRKVALLNCSYELDHAYNSFSLLNLLRFVRRTVFGCSAGIAIHPEFGPVHLRTLDWPIPGMADASCRIEFKAAHGTKIIAAGFPGFLGILSGLRLDGYSATINWAPPAGLADFHWGPAFLLREVLTQCATFLEAQEALLKTPLSTSVFYTLCGRDDSEACVIERTQDASALRLMGNSGYLAQTNHHQAESFLSRNATLNEYPDDPVALSTWDRLRALELGLRDVVEGPSATLQDYFGVISSPVLSNRETVQRMIICPRRNVFEIERPE